MFKNLNIDEVIQFEAEDRDSFDLKWSVSLKLCELLGWCWTIGEHYDVSNSTKDSKWFLPKGWSPEKVGSGEWTFYNPADISEGFTIFDIDIAITPKAYSSAFSLLRALVSYGFTYDLTSNPLVSTCVILKDGEAVSKGSHSDFALCIFQAILSGLDTFLDTVGTKTGALEEDIV